MPTSIKSPNAGSTYVNPVKVGQGGHGEVSAAAGLAALDGISKDQVGKALGPIPLLADGSIDPKYLAGLSLTDSGIDGSMTIMKGESQDYFITTYDSYAEYTLTGILGEVSRLRNVITFKAGDDLGVGGFTINGRLIPITVTGMVVSKPSIVVPVANAADVALSVQVETSAFVVVGGEDIHVSSDWELATDVNFLNIVASTTGDTANLTSWTVSNMKELTRHYVRCRHNSQNHGTSAWSSPSAFTTKNNGTFEEYAKFYASDPISVDYFGGGAALNADATFALVGAHGVDGNGNASGAAYIFTRIGNIWTQQQKLTANDRILNDYFGYGMALNADATIALIGAFGDDDAASESGSVYVFTRNGTIWTQQQKLHASDAAASDNFGESVAVNADATIALIGAYRDDDKGTDTGTVYVFTRSGSVWTQQQKLYAEDAAASDYFGYAVALNSDATIALISAYTDDDVVVNSGSVYVFTRSGTVWTQQQKLHASDASASDCFGSALALNSDATIALIGAYGVNYPLTDSGAAYIFTRTGAVWTQKQKIYAGDAGNTDCFGSSCALSADGTMALIGAYCDDDKGADAGAVYFFQ